MTYDTSRNQILIKKELFKIGTDNISILDILLSLWIYFQFNRSIACVSVNREFLACLEKIFNHEMTNVCLGDVNESGAQEVANKINSAIVCQRDMACTVNAFGSINVSVLNAGINKPLMFLDITEENWDMIMKVNGKNCKTNDSLQNHKCGHLHSYRNAVDDKRRFESFNRT